MLEEEEKTWCEKSRRKRRRCWNTSLLQKPEGQMLEEVVRKEEEHVEEKMDEKGEIKRGV